MKAFAKKLKRPIDVDYLYNNKSRFELNYIYGYEIDGVAYPVTYYNNYKSCKRQFGGLKERVRRGESYDTNTIKLLSKQMFTNIKNPEARILMKDLFPDAIKELMG